MIIVARRAVARACASITLDARDEVVMRTMMCVFFARVNVDADVGTSRCDAE